MEIDGKDWTAAEIAKLDKEDYEHLVSRSRSLGDFPDQIDFIEGARSEKSHVKTTETDEGTVSTVEDDDAPYPEWTVTELREELEVRGLETSGKKGALIARLEENDETSA